jgi:hypothetical protein
MREGSRTGACEHLARPRGRRCAAVSGQPARVEGEDHKGRCMVRRQRARRIASLASHAICSGSTERDAALHEKRDRLHASPRSRPGPGPGALPLSLLPLASHFRVRDVRSRVRTAPPQSC